MNHLAPLVAAVARDEVLHDLQEDNEKLRNKIHRLETESQSWTIQITGPEGSPVYSTGQVTEREVLEKTNEGGYDNDYGDIRIVMNEEVAFENGLDSFQECQLVLTTSLGRRIVKQINNMNGHDVKVYSPSNRKLLIGYRYSDEFWNSDGNNWAQTSSGNLIIFTDIMLTIPIPPDYVLTPELQNRQGVTTAYYNNRELTTEELLSIVENTGNRDTPITITEVYVRMGDLIRTYQN